jgi:hypothetical protein
VCIHSYQNTTSLFDNWNEERETRRVRLGFKDKLETYALVWSFKYVSLCLRNPYTAYDGREMLMVKLSTCIVSRIRETALYA